MSDWEKGFSAGWKAAIQNMGGVYEGDDATTEMIGRLFHAPPPKKKKKRRQSKKQRILKEMTNKKWKGYGGKKTWVQLRAQVSRSQAYKKKVRGL